MSTAAQEVCVLGIGARTAVGHTAQTSAAAVRSGISRVAEHPYMLDKESQPYMVAMDPQIEGNLRFDRVRGLLDGALGQVTALVGRATQGMPVFVAIPEALRAQGTAVARDVVEKLPGARVSTLAADHAGGVLALEHAIREISSGSAEACVVAGVDSHIDPHWLEQLDNERKLASVVNHFGFAPGEAGGALVLASRRMVETHKLPALGSIVVAASAQEPAPMGTDGICTGIGLGKAMTQALRHAEGANSVHTMYCDLNGQRYRDGEFAWATQRVPAGVLADMSDFIAPADCWGDIGAATVPLLIALALESGNRGYCRGSRALVWVGSPTRRERGAVLLHLKVPSQRS